MSDELLDAELVDKDQDLERLRQLRQQKVTELSDPLLKAIAQRESTGGSNVAHREMKRTMHRGDQAGGSFGIMPITAMEEAVKSPEFMSKYPEFEKSMQDKKLITEDLNLNPEMDIELAKAILARRAGRLSKGAKDLDAEVAYSWHNGLQGALNARKDGRIEKDPYTKDVLAELLKSRKTNIASE